MKLKFDVTDEGKAIGLMIDNWSKRSAVLVHDLHVILTSCVVHVTKHGNVTPARNIVNALGTKQTAWRSNAVLAWFEAYGPFIYNKTTKQLDYDAGRIDEFKAEFNADSAAFIAKRMKETFEVFKPQSEYEGFDLQKEVAKLIKKAHTAVEKHKDSGKVNVAGLEAFEQTFAVTYQKAA